MVPEAAIFHSYRGQELHRQAMGKELRDAYSSPYLSVHRADLHTVLLEEAQRLGVVIRLNSNILKINTASAKPSIMLSTGETFECDVIIGADGQRSVCRESLLGNDPPIDSGDEVFRITVNTSQVIKHPELVGLVDPPNFNLWAGPQSMAMVYPLKKDNLFNIVMARAHGEGLRHTIKLGPQKVEISEVRAAFSGWDPRFESLLNMAEDCSKWTMLKANELPHWSDPEGKICLVGDAAHAIGPFLGQGAAISFEDAAILGVLFSKIWTQAQVPDVLTILEQMRKERTGYLLRRSERYRHVLMTSNGPRQEERDRQLLENAPFDGFANFLADPALTKFMYEYDAFAEAEKAWGIYLKGEWPETRGLWLTSDVSR